MDRHIPQETDGARARSVRRVTWIGLGVNLLLSAVKLAGGLIGRSQVVVADAVHSLSDSSTDVAVLVGVAYWSRPPDRRHPYGHGRIETVVTAGIGVALAAVAVGLAYNAATTLQGARAAGPGPIAFAAALVSIVCKEALYQWTVRLGRRIGSSAVVANAWHHRSDALSSAPAALAVAGAWINPDWRILDQLGALVVSAFIFRAAFLITMPALKELIDAGATEEQLREIERIALKAEGVAEVHAIRTRLSGGALRVDLHILVDGSMSVRRGHEVSERVKRRLIEQGPRVADVVVHLEPAGGRPDSRDDLDRSGDAE